MIPKAIILAVAKEESLRDTTIEKDYVLGWMLHGIAQHPRLSRWVFKGGTCLKKCFFETYRFSEDLDFTVQAADPVDASTIEVALREVCTWVTDESGIEFPGGRVDVEEYTNKQGTTTAGAARCDRSRTSDGALRVREVGLPSGLCRARRLRRAPARAWAASPAPPCRRVRHLSRRGRCGLVPRGREVRFGCSRSDRQDSVRLLRPVTEAASGRVSCTLRACGKLEWRLGGEANPMR